MITGVASATDIVTYYHVDQLGSPKYATDDTGALKWKEQYKPFGERRLKEADSVNPQTGMANDNGWADKIWYTGKEEELGMDINYFGARWYDPQLGRFLARDPVGFQNGNVHSFNRYTYVNNNPYKYIDPDGEFAQLIWGGIGGAAFDAALQGIAIASGTQDEFSWGQLGKSTLVGAATGGLSLATKAVSIKRAVDASKAAKGITAKNGVKVDGFTGHGVDRAIGNGSDRAGVSPKGILDALKNPLKIGDVKTDKLGRQSQRFTGEIGEVVVNPQTSKVISVNPTSTKKAARLKRQLDNQ
ncbi:MAG TPA: hypothetical protein DCE52_18565 [Rhodobacteraceae bacterium]|nr:hypothetical protein [Paracoccaceae bacterium]